MALSIPTDGVVDYTLPTTDVGAGSVSGGWAVPFNLASDVTTITVRFRPSVITGHMGAILQSSPDGGTTYYDIARTSTMSLANAVTAQWLVGSTIVPGVNPRGSGTASITGGAIGAAGASTLSSQQVSGLPLLGTANRVFLIMGGGVTQNDGCRVEVFANGQISNN